MADDFRSLGEELAGDYRLWLGGLLAGWIDPEAADTTDALEELGRLEDAVASVAEDQAELGRVRAWLTAGFQADAPPLAVLAAAPEAEEEEADVARRPRSSDLGRSATEPARRAPPSVDPFAGEGARGSPVDAGSIRGAFDLPALEPTSGGMADRGDAEENRSPAAIPNRAQDDRRRTSVAPPVADRTTDRDRWGDAPGRPADADRPSAFDADLPRDVPAARSAGAIGGLAGLAALAGSSGIEIPTAEPSAPRPDRWDADGSSTLPSASPRSWSEPGPSGSTPRMGEPRLDPRPEPRRRAWPEAESASTDVGTRSLASTETRVEEADQGREWERMLAELGSAIAFPFERMPGEMEDDAADEAAPSFPAPPIAGPPAVPNPAATSGGWGGEDAVAAPFPADADKHLVARAGRLGGPRLRPAAEILGALGAAPAAEAAISLPAAPTAATPPASTTALEPVAPPAPATPREWQSAAIQPQPVIVRTVAHPADDHLPEPPSWPEADVSDVLDALAREIMHEYRRYYGE